MYNLSNPLKIYTLLTGLVCSIGCCTSNADMPSGCTTQVMVTASWDHQPRPEFDVIACHNNKSIQVSSFSDPFDSLDGALYVKGDPTRTARGYLQMESNFGHPYGPFYICPDKAGSDTPTSGNQGGFFKSDPSITSQKYTCNSNWN